MNLANALTYQAQTRPHAAALIQEGLTLSFARLERAVWRAAAALRAQGIGPQDLVGVGMGNYVLNIVTTLALARLGAVSLGLNPIMPAARRRAIADRFRPGAVIVFKPEHGIEGFPTIQADPDWMRPAAAAPERFEPFDGTGKPWRLTLTSGTTGVPKGIPYLHDITLVRMRLEQSLIGLGPAARFLSSTDINVSVGLSPCLRHLFAGNTVVMMPTWTPAGFLAAIDRHGITHGFTTPVMLDSVLSGLKGPMPRCPDLQFLAVAGGRLSPETVNLAVARLSPAIANTYGMSECGTLTISDLRTMLRYPGSVGRVVPWMEIQVVDEQGAMLPAGVEGLLRVRGTGMFSGYHDDPEANARVLREGWFYCGDRGTLSADGLLQVGARADEVVNFGGQKADLAQVDQALRGHPDIADAAAFVMTHEGAEQLAAAVVTRGEPDEAALLADCRERLGLRLLRRIVRVPALPRSDAGKLLRAELAQRLSPPATAPDVPAR